MLRPEPLWPLFKAVETLDGVGPKTARKLEKLNISTIRDLLFTLPVQGIDRPRLSRIADRPGSYTAVFEGRVIQHVPPSAKGRPYRVHLNVGGDTLTLVYFHPRSGYLQSILPEGAVRCVSGKVERFDQSAQIVHPDYVLPPEDRDRIPVFEPVYPLTAGISQNLMQSTIRAALAVAIELPEWIDLNLRAERKWPAWHSALMQAHHPQGHPDLLPIAPARERLAYDELFSHQLTLNLVRQAKSLRRGRKNTGNGTLVAALKDALPYALTGAQTRAIDEITQDMAEPISMNRLLMGDVGAGKTVVALMALLTAVEAGGQGALMAPTEILARQHFYEISHYCEQLGVQAACLTGRDSVASRRDILRQLKEGEISIMVGTHALFQKTAEFNDLRLAVIDEQHRFGVEQRITLREKGDRADMLFMSATPIPRSLALASYGDMDMSVLDEKPPGRKPITTALVNETRIQEVVERLRGEFSAGQQAYWVCPLVEESETADMIAAEVRHETLKKALADVSVGIVHGQMPASEKDAVMQGFINGEVQLLVATTVIEVGVNVPTANVMVIERAERFGLAQLHQLRGRVGRGRDDAACVLLYRAPLNATARSRLETMRETNDGFRIAEMDLQLRGAGDVIGTAQSGIPQFRIADLERQADLLAVAQKDARNLVTQAPNLSSPRGQAAKQLLWVMEQDKAVSLINAG